MAPLDLIGTDEVALICQSSRRTVEDWIRKGWLTPEATISTAHLWERSTIEQWQANGRPHGQIVPRHFDLYGTDDVARLRGVKPRTIMEWQRTGRHSIPQPISVGGQGTLCWHRADVAGWLEALA